MNVIKNIPGPILIFMGALSLSFGGLIVKSFDGATLWQILFWRSLFFSLTVLAFLVISYRKKTFKAKKNPPLQKQRRVMVISVYHLSCQRSDILDTCKHLLVLFSPIFYAP